MISYQTLQKEIENARVAELADAHGSGPCESNFMGVQVPPLAPVSYTHLMQSSLRRTPSGFEGSGGALLHYGESVPAEAWMELHCYQPG